MILELFFKPANKLNHILIRLSIKEMKQHIEADFTSLK